MSLTHLEIREGARALTPYCLPNSPDSNGPALLCSAMLYGLQMVLLSGQDIEVPDETRADLARRLGSAAILALTAADILLADTDGDAVLLSLDSYVGLLYAFEWALRLVPDKMWPEFFSFSSSELADSLGAWIELEFTGSIGSRS